MRRRSQSAQRQELSVSAKRSPNVNQRQPALTVGHHGQSVLTVWRYGSLSRQGYGGCVHRVDRGRGLMSFPLTRG